MVASSHCSCCPWEVESVLLPGSPLQHHLGQVVWLLPHKCSRVISVLSAGQQMQQAKHLDLQGRREAGPWAVGEQLGGLVGFAWELQLTSRHWAVSGRAAVGGVRAAAWLFQYSPFA